MTAGDGGLPWHAGVPTVRRIDASDTAALAAGAAFLGSGGGGDVALAEQLLRHTLGAGTIEVVPASGLAPSDVVVHVGVAGAPYVLNERPPHGADLATAVRAVGATVGRAVRAVGVIEIGGVNAFMALVAAASLRLPVVDGDLMGRAFPHIDQTTLALAGHAMSPVALVGPSGATVLLDPCPNADVERLLWANTQALGGVAAIAMYPTTAEVLAGQGIDRSLSICRFLGAELMASAGSETVPALTARIGADLLFEGRVDEIRPRAGALPGSVTVADHDGRIVRVDLLDEYLNVSVDGLSVAATPDILVAVDPAGLTPVDTERLHRGQAMTMIRLASIHLWPAAAMPHVGPAAFGLEAVVPGG